MYMLNHFTTAKDTPSDLWRDPDIYTVLSRGSLHTDPEDPCDPILSTYVVQITTLGYARALRDTLRGNTRTPDESVEQAIADWLGNFLAPATHCNHEWDCCGCRTGSFEVKHLGGAVFLCQSRTSRNY